MAISKRIGSAVFGERNPMIALRRRRRRQILVLRESYAMKMDTGLICYRTE